MTPSLNHLPKAVGEFVRQLQRTGFVEVARDEGPMDSGSIEFRREPTTITLIKDRGQWFAALTADGWGKHDSLNLGLFERFRLWPSHDRWEPTIDLVGVALAVGAVLTADVYHSADLRVATSSGVPATDGSPVDVVRRRVLAAVEVEAPRAPAPPGEPDNESVRATISEAASAEDATFLAAAAHDRWSRGALAFAEDRLCCLILGGASWVGERHWEPRGRLRRFEDPIRTVLREALAG